MDTEPRYNNEVTARYRNDLQSLAIANEAVEQLLSHPGWQVVQGILEGVERQDDRDHGKPLTHEEYAMAHGKRIGFRATRDVIAAIRTVYAREATKQRQANERAAEPALGR